MRRDTLHESNKVSERTYFGFEFLFVRFQFALLDVIMSLA